MKFINANKLHRKSGHLAIFIMHSNCETALSPQLPGSPRGEGFRVRFFRAPVWECVLPSLPIFSPLSFVEGRGCAPALGPC